MKKELVVLLASFILVGCVSKSKKISSISKESIAWANYLGISEKYVVEIFNEPEGYEQKLYDEKFCKEKAREIFDFNQQLSRDDSVVNKAILVIIRSNGGSLLGTLTICQAIEKAKYPVYTLAHQALSGGAHILAAGAKGHRYVKANTHVMIQLPTFEFSIGFFGTGKQFEGTSKQFKREFPKAKRTLKNLRKIDEVLFKSLAYYTGQPIEKIRRDLYEKEEIWLFRKKIVEYGLADVILPIKSN